MMGTIRQINRFDPKAIRKRLGLNQQEFWGRIGVAQSAGSRYESGRRMPKPVQELLRIVHIESIDLSRVHAQDFAVLNYLKENEPAFFQRVSALVVTPAMQGFAARNAAPAAPEPGFPGSDHRQRELPASDVLTAWATHRANVQAIGVQARRNPATASEEVRDADTPAVAVAASRFSVEHPP